MVAASCLTQPYARYVMPPTPGLTASATSAARMSGPLPPPLRRARPNPPQVQRPTRRRPTLHQRHRPFPYPLTFPNIRPAFHARAVAASASGLLARRSTPLLTLGALAVALAQLGLDFFRGTQRESPHRLSATACLGSRRLRFRVIRPLDQTDSKPRRSFRKAFRHYARPPESLTRLPEPWAYSLGYWRWLHCSYP